MGFITIDQNKCKQCGICIETCPKHIIISKDGFPSLMEGEEQTCTRCGHCVIVCPQSALSHIAMKPEDCPLTNQEMAIDDKHVEYLFRSRRSIRNFKDQSPDRKTIQRLIEIARCAPTGMNRQEIKWTVVNSKKEVHEIISCVIDYFRHLIQEKNPIAQKYRFDRTIRAWESGKNPFFQGSPSLIFTHSPVKYGLPAVDCAIALTYLDIAASSLELGACWAGILMLSIPNWGPLQQLVGIPEEHACLGAMLLGYPKHKYHRLPLRKTPDITWL